MRLRGLDEQQVVRQHLVVAGYSRCVCTTRNASCEVDKTLFYFHEVIHLHPVAHAAIQRSSDL